MTHRLRTERPEPPKHAKISKYMRYSLRLKGRRAVMALEARIRSKARRLGLKAKHHRGIGGWSASNIHTGETVVERCFDYAMEERLDVLMVQKQEARI